MNDKNSKKEKITKKKKTKFSDLPTFSWEKEKHNNSENIDNMIYK
ncbi:MAG: hypothetical protein ABII07_00520 [Patescibacteria group bacterium]